MPRSPNSYRSKARNAALREGNDALTWEGVPTRREFVQNRGETYQPNGDRERARRAGRFNAIPAHPGEVFKNTVARFVDEPEALQ